MRKKAPIWRRLLPLLVLLIVLPVALIIGSRGLLGRADQENLKLAEQSIRRAAVQCYALEGFYPLDLSYLQSHYGVAVDQERFLVGYQYVAANLMPDITVLPMPE